jgi:biotin carboxylase|tara:strand:+ start:1364 stop:2557 length:1194 start_codon:yes stop_codon:yes gene_type:complete
LKSKVLVVGAGPLQVPLINELNNLGFYTISISNLPNDPGLEIASKGKNISILDFSNIEKMFMDDDVNFAITCGSDLGTLSVAKICEKFNKTGIGTKHVLNVSHKGKFYNLLKKLSLNRVPYFIVTKRLDLTSILKKIKRFPVVVKPLFSSGSRGISILNNQDEIIKNHEVVFNASTIFKGYVIQEYIDGIEVGAECFIENNKIVFLQFTIKTKNVYNVPIGHFVPNKLSLNIVKIITNEIQTIVNYLGIDNSPANLDIIINNKNKPFIIDLGFRLGGNMLPDLMKLKYGFNPYLKIINYALGEKSNNNFSDPKSGKYGSIIFHSNSNGNLSKNKIIMIRNLFGKLENANIVFDISAGASYEKFIQGNKRFGHSLCQFRSIEHYRNVFSSFNKIVNSN